MGENEGVGGVNAHNAQCQMHLDSIKHNRRDKRTRLSKLCSQINDEIEDINELELLQELEEEIFPIHKALKAIDEQYKTVIASFSTPQAYTDKDKKSL